MVDFNNNPRRVEGGQHLVEIIIYFFIYCIHYILKYFLICFLIILLSVEYPPGGYDLIIKKNPILYNLQLRNCFL
jgi:hypothetical protein